MSKYVRADKSLRMNEHALHSRSHRRNTDLHFTQAESTVLAVVDELRGLHGDELDDDKLDDEELHGLHGGELYDDEYLVKGWVMMVDLLKGCNRRVDEINLLKVNILLEESEKYRMEGDSQIGVVLEWLVYCGREWTTLV